MTEVIHLPKGGVAPKAPHTIVIYAGLGRNQSGAEDNQDGQKVF